MLNPNYALNHLKMLATNNRHVDPKLLTTLTEKIQTLKELRKTWDQLRQHKNFSQGKSYDHKAANELKSKITELDESACAEFYALPNYVQSDVSQSPLVFKLKTLSQPTNQLTFLEIFQADNLIQSKLGTRLYYFTGAYAELMHSLKNACIKNASNFNFLMVKVPVLADAEMLFESGHLPKFATDMFQLTNGNYLIPTSEVSLLRVAKTMCKRLSKPLLLQTVSACFRQEVGNTKEDNLPWKRMHQFHKLELFAVTHAKASEAAHLLILKTATNLLEMLDISYRVIVLDANDTSFASTKTYDVEVWLPNSQTYMEISSCSNCHDFQTARAKLKDPKDKTYLHTLNGTGLAIERLMIAILEYYGNVASALLRVKKLLLELDSNQQPND